MLLHSASQLVTVKGGPQRGEQLGNLSVIENGAVFFQGDKIIEVGTSDEMLRKYANEDQISAENNAVLPGLIDPHTHLVWAGNRAGEFEMRLQGKSYMEIMNAGGGIQSTVNATRDTSYESLLEQTSKRALTAFRYGTTTTEAKSGYGLAYDAELKQLKVAMAVNKEGPLEIVPTFLGAHAIPSEFKDNPQAYVDIVCTQMLPDLKQFWTDAYGDMPLPFVDVFCEMGAFDLAQSRIILETAKSLGFPLKIHADEFVNLGGASLAAEMGAISADHLVKTNEADIQALAQSDSVAVSLPCTPFGLAEEEYSPAKNMIDAGCLFAIASDLNPGTAWCGNMQFTMALACRTMGLTPAQAIAASTINAAAAVQRQDDLGSIEKGKQADMIILETRDYRQLPYQFGTNQVKTIIKKGIVYNQSDLC